MDKEAADDEKEVLDEEEDDECFDYDYYNEADAESDLGWCDGVDCRAKDNEHFDYECLLVEQVERLLNESVESISSTLHINPSQAKVLLYTHDWNIERLKENHSQQPPKSGNEATPSSAVVYTSAPVHGLSSTSAPFTASNSCSLYYTSRYKQYLHDQRSTTAARPSSPALTTAVCNICMQISSTDKFICLSCKHLFCRDCWQSHLEYQVGQGHTISIECMAQACHLLVPEDFALELLTRTSLREKYQQFAFTAYVQSHPELRFCPGQNCNMIIKAKERKAKRVECKNCRINFCFKCGCEYHAPTDCDTIKKWLTKCADDSETANYISAHTKDCPKCHICIEKNGGCNHMQCFSCKTEFCWVCLGDWKAHGSEYYECSRYKENPAIVNSVDNTNARAREALKKYLFYYERWENHARSLRLEEQTLARIKERIHEKVMSNKGTWIDWQYLIEAARLLAKCRYTLQYTYPYAYFMEGGARKQLFEYQQAQLEAEIENLSWKIERAETTDRGDLENQMDIAEKRRATLLKDFLSVS